MPAGKEYAASYAEVGGEDDDDQLCEWRSGNNEGQESK